MIYVSSVLTTLPPVGMLASNAVIFVSRKQLGEFELLSLNWCPCIQSGHVPPPFRESIVTSVLRFGWLTHILHNLITSWAHFIPLDQYRQESGNITVGLQLVSPEMGQRQRHISVTLS